MTIDKLKETKARLAVFRSGRERNFLLESADMQLEYLIGFLSGIKKTSDKMKELSIGIIAVREIEGIDDDLAESLYEIDLWVKKDLLPML